MGFSAKQVQALRRNLDHRHVRTREAHGRELSYLEGWYAISEANRIFGFDGWNRETVESKCVLARENRGTFLAVYIARVRVTVHADGATIIREGHGTGEGHGTSPGEVHDIALKVAETDATKRALATFGKPFGLELYRGGRTTPSSQKPLPSPPHCPCARADVRLGFHPDDTTPIPRPSRYYGRRQDLVTRDRAQGRRQLEMQHPSGSSIVPVAPGLVPGQIDKSVLTIAEPKRLRDKAHLRFVASQPCLVCGRQPSAIRITCGLPNPEPSASKSATSSPCRSAAAIIDSCIRPAMRWHGGRTSSQRARRSPRSFGNRRTQNLRLPIPRCRPLPMSKVEDAARWQCSEEPRSVSRPAHR